MKVMLACQADINRIVFPVYASPKIDGIRCFIGPRGPVTRNGKVIPNYYVRCLLINRHLFGFDGELVVGRPNDDNTMQRTASGIMSHDGQPDFTFYAFDFYDPIIKRPYSERYELMAKKIDRLKGEVEIVSDFRFRLLEQHILHNQEELDLAEQNALSNGYEGLMIRSLNGLYKNGRSTVKEGYLLKIKRFQDSEAMVVDVIELMHNNNPATINSLGYTERSSHKENKVPANKMGALRVSDVRSGVEFQIGTGFDDAQRVEFWQKRNSLIGKILTYKFFPSGVKNLPRFPTFKCFRGDL